MKDLRKIEVDESLFDLVDVYGASDGVRVKLRLWVNGGYRHYYIHNTGMFDCSDGGILNGEQFAEIIKIWQQVRGG